MADGESLGTGAGFQSGNQLPGGVAWKSRGAPKVEARGWCGYWRFLFNASPHILNFPATNSMFNSEVGRDVKSNQWYEMQLLLNPGDGAHIAHLPLDWQYAIGLFDDLSGVSKRTEPARNLVYLIKGAQEMDNGVGVVDTSKGWTSRDSSPLDVWKFGQKGIWAGVPTSTEVPIVNAFLQTWLDRTTSFDLSVWQRMGSSNDDGTTSCAWSMRELCPTGYVPNTMDGPINTVENFPTWAYNRIPQMRTEGVDGTQLNRFLTWLNSAYPSGGYLALKQ